MGKFSKKMFGGRRAERYKTRKQTGDGDRILVGGSSMANISTASVTPTLLFAADTWGDNLPSWVSTITPNRYKFASIVNPGQARLKLREELARTELIDVDKLEFDGSYDNDNSRWVAQIEANSAIGLTTQGETYIGADLEIISSDVRQKLGRLTVEFQVLSNATVSESNWQTINLWEIPPQVHGGDRDYFRLTTVAVKQSPSTQRVSLNPFTISSLDSSDNTVNRARFIVRGLQNNSSITVVARLLNYSFEGTANLMSFWGVV